MLPSQGYVSVSRRPPDVEDYIDIVRRYRSWIIGPLFAGLVLSVVVAFLWPDTYVSSAVMRITPQQIPDRLVPSNLNLQMGDRLVQMQQEIESRGSLAEMIQRPSLNLYPKERQSKPMEDVVELMRKDIHINLIETGASATGRRAASAFQISFAYTDKYKAQAVVRELVTKFTEQNVQVSRVQTQAATTFLNDQLAQAKGVLDRLDRELTEFRIANAGKLPEELQPNLSTMTALQSQLASVTETLNRNSQEKMALETNLQNLKNQLALWSSMANENSSTGGQERSVKNEHLVQLNKSILDAETRLAAFREIYKDDYPDVRTLRAELKVLYKQREELQKEEDEQQQVEAQAREKEKAAKEAVARKMSPQTASSLEQIRASIKSAETAIQAKDMDIRERTKQQAQLHDAIQKIQARIDVSPLNEQKYVALQRDYALAKENYDAMSKKKDASETSQALEDRKAGENLEVLDPASAPDSPTEPNRLLIAAAGTGIGFLIGVFLAGAKEMKDTSLKNLKDVRAYTNLAVLSSIPLLENALLVRRKRRLFWLAWTSAVIVGTVAMAGSMYYYYFGKA
jgi:succinoglycan biosynthesis transport protein ExoP